MNLTREMVRPKLLGEDCWIALGGEDSVSIRIDYLTDGEDSEHRRLQRLWMYRINEDKDQHPDSFLMLKAVKEFSGNTTVDGKAYQFPDPEPIEPGAEPTEEQQRRLDIVQVLKALNLFEKALLLTKTKLYFGSDEKKSSPSPPTSGEAASSQPSNKENPGASDPGPTG